MFLGIDISKTTFDVALLKEDASKPRHKRFANNRTGFSQLADWLTARKAHPLHACLGATGTSGEALALFLHERGHRVSLVNPAQIYHFAQSSLCRAKTDKVGAQHIARFCQLHQPAPWTPPVPQIRILQALVRRLDALQQMRQSQKNRLAAGPLAPEVSASIQTVLTFKEGLGRSRGGLSTKIPLTAEGRARPLSVVLSEGQTHDSMLLEKTLDAVGVPRPGRGRPKKRPGKLRGDKGYSYPRCRKSLRCRGIRHLIPERRDQQERRQKKGRAGGRPVVFVKAEYAQRNVVERCILRLKQWRRVATRYDKRASMYLAFVTLASIMLWLR